MNITHLRNKSAIAAVGAAVAAAALPAFLFTGPGNAQAATTLNTASDAVGVTSKCTRRGAKACAFTPPNHGLDGRPSSRCRCTRFRSFCRRTKATTCGSRASRLAPHGKRKLNAPSAALTISIPFTEDPHAFGGVIA